MVSDDAYFLILSSFPFDGCYIYFFLNSYYFSWTLNAKNIEKINIFKFVEDFVLILFINIILVIINWLKS